VDSPAAGSNGWTTLGQRVRAKRAQQSESLARLVDGLQHASRSGRVAVVGDFNAFEFGDGYVDVVGTVKGTPADADHVVQPTTPGLVSPPLTNLVEGVPAVQRYSYNFDGNAQVLDQFLVSEGLLALGRGLTYSRSNADFPDSLRGDATRPERLSDHDAPVAYFRFPSADLAVTKTASAATVNSGAPLSYTLTVSNQGLDIAAVTLTDPLPAGVTFEAVEPPAGWSCTGPAIGSSGTVSCQTGGLPVGPASTIRIGGRASCALVDGAALVNTASVTGDLPDPSLGDNTASATVTVLNPAPAIGAVATNPPRLWPPNHQMVDVEVSYRVSDNCDPAPACSIGVASDEPLDGSGDGHTSADWQVLDAHRVRLRAERAGGGKGRTYTLTVTCRDAQGASSTGAAQVTVPHNR
jgi:hypothetical protein